MTRIDLRSDTVTLPVRRHAAGDGSRAGRRRPVWRGPVGQPVAGADRRVARQGSGAVRAERDDGEPDRPQSADPARRRGRARARGAYRLARIRAPARPIRACSSPRSAAAACLPRPICAPPTSRRGISSFRRRRLVAIENTHNRGGGVVFPQQDASAICAAARELGMASYLDGARLFNAAAASGRKLAELAAPFDLVSVALSKGLGCPVGSVLAGSRADDRPRPPRAAHVRRGDAAGRHSRRRRAVGARPQYRPARRGPRQCAAAGGAARRAARRRTRSRHRAEQYRDLPYGQGHAGRRDDRCAARRRRGCWSRPLPRARCAPSPIST